MDGQEMDGPTGALAATLGITDEEFEDLFGRVLGGGAESGRSRPRPGPERRTGFDVTPWHVQGRPAALIIRVFDHRVFVAQPRAAYDGVAPAGFHRWGQVYLARHELAAQVAEVVARLVTRRRRSFLLVHLPSAGEFTRGRVRRPLQPLREGRQLSRGGASVGDRAGGDQHIARPPARSGRSNNPADRHPLVASPRPDGTSVDGADPPTAFAGRRATNECRAKSETGTWVRPANIHLLSP